ncbi:glycosyltransferase family 4 protein [Candidatus Omnitrophota bacterium]
MNICFLCRNFHKDSGGIETFTLNFSKALAEAGHRVHILCEDKGDFNREKCDENIFIHYVAFNDHPFPGVWTIEKFFPLEDLRYSAAAARAIDALNVKHPIDIVETFDYFRQGFVYTRRRNRVAVFLRLHGWFFNRTEGRVDPWPSLNFKERMSWRMHRDTLLKVDGVAAVAKDTGDFEKKVWRTERDIQTIYNAVDTNSFFPQGERDFKQVLFAGRLIPRKGIEVLAQAMPLVIKACPDVKLIVAGADALSDDGKENSQMLREKIGSANFEYLGQVNQEQIKLLLRKSAILIMPSLDEAFPMSTLEAMASECALVTSTVGGLKELIEHEEDGLLVDPNDAVMLAEAMIRLLKDQHLCQRLAAKGLEKVKIRYSYQKLVEASIEAYQRAIETHKS